MAARGENTIIGVVRGCNEYGVKSPGRKIDLEVLQELDGCGSTLTFGEVDVPEGEAGHRSVEHTRLAFHEEDDAHFRVHVRWDQVADRLSGQEKESCVVHVVVFNVRLDDRKAVELRGEVRRDGSTALQPLVPNVFR